MARRYGRLLLIPFILFCWGLWALRFNRTSTLKHDVSSPPDQGASAVPARRDEILARRQNYSTVMVIARTSRESVDWVTRDLPGLPTAIYTVDDPTALLRPPTNKGNEAMVYLTYIVDNYSKLSDITIFTHAHKQAWHNTGLLERMTSNLVKRLNGVRVERQGYVNLRCDWEPGCPAWIATESMTAGSDRDGGAAFRVAWSEIHANRPIPAVVGQACCSQFAVSRAGIQATPLRQWEQYRSWLLGTNLSDYRSGRVFEHMWHYLFTGEGVWCPELSTCYCDGFGVCFGSPEKMGSWLAEGKRLETLSGQYLHERASGVLAAGLKTTIDDLDRQLQSRLDEAIREGDKYMDLINR